MPRRLQIQRKVGTEELELLRSMADDAGTDERTRKRAAAVLAIIETGDLAVAAARSGISASTVSKIVKTFDESGWQSLITVQSPRGGDFLSRYDQGYWAERLARVYLGNSKTHRAIPYGTSRSEPFTDLQTFRDYVVNEQLLQAWSAGQRWKRPDLLLIPRFFLVDQGGNDTWSPDLKHWDNGRCAPFVSACTAAIEVETSLWQVRRATVSLSFTVKEEDLECLRSWVRANAKPLYIIQVFYDEAHALPFSVLESLVGPGAPSDRKVVPEVDRFTGKNTYMVPLNEGTRLGSIPETELEVEGRIFKAPNGRVTVYGRLTGSHIEVEDHTTLERMVSGKLGLQP